MPRWFGPSFLAISVFTIFFGGLATATVTAEQKEPESAQYPLQSTIFPTNTLPPDIIALTGIPTATPVAPSNTPLPTNTLLPTNTPTTTFTPSATPTFTETPSLTNDPLATPTVLYPLNPEPGAIAGGTAIPTRMPLLVSRDREGNEYEIINFLLLGHDSASIEQQDGVFRTDTMIIVSVNLTTDTVSMLSLPRDLYVYIPGWTMQRLNLAWGRGESSGWTDGGFGLLRQTILYNFGIRVHYFAMVDFNGFKQIIDTLGGVNIPVDCPIQDYRFTGEYDENDEPIFELVTLPVGYQKMDNITALFYARSRKNSSDFDRGRRQQQLLRAIWHAAQQGNYLTNIPQLYNDLTSIVETNIPIDVFVRLAPLAFSIEPNEVENHFFRLGFETQPWTTPDGSNVQLPRLAIIDTIRAFLTPPTENQLVTDVSSIAVYDNSGQGLFWDIVASERLVWEGLLPFAGGEASPPSVVDNYLDDRDQTLIIDYTGQTKGSSLDAVIDTLNIPDGNVIIEPDPDRTFDYVIYLSDDYQSCVDRDVIEPVEVPLESGQ